MSAKPTYVTPPPVTLQLLDTTIPILRLTQSVSAVSFSIFSIIHLSAPLTALLPSRPKYITSPENRANGFLLIGRELYQGEWSEPILVYGSLGLHVLSGVVNRGLKVLQLRERRKWKREQLRIEMKNLTSSSNERELNDFAKLNQGEKEMLVEELDDLDAEIVVQVTSSDGEEQKVEEEDVVVPSASKSLSTIPRLTSHQATGYALIPIVFHHLYVHRILPSSPLPPISSLSPSFFNYSFTSLSLNHSSLYLRIASTLSYASLASIATYHALVGLRILSDPTAPRSLAPKRPKVGPPSRRRRITKGREWQAVWMAVVVGLGVGTARIAGKLGGEGIVRGGNPDWIARRMEYVLKKGWGVAS
ncbi:uncharacterized protein JCM6883_002856 [Sporobolomyces salmoneus]|uniref:uncharacterized protein n=1 Tax=Sporobolomyces salmoneus TaxID=183962 RepID=UPI00316F86A1